jgi:hypothetical protein
VDLARVRLQGTERGAPVPRRPRTAVEEATARRSARLAAAIEALEDAPAAAMDSLLLLRVDALGDSPALAAALGDAIEALGAGRDATVPLLRARRALDGAPETVGKLSPWAGGIGGDW